MTMTNNNAIPNDDSVRHIAYCTGPFQLAFLLGMWDHYHIPHSHCAIFYYNYVENDTMMTTLRALAEAHGVTMYENEQHVTQGASYFSDLFEPPVTRRFFWYSKAIAVSFPAFDLLSHIRPHGIVHFYESYHSAISLLKTREILESADAPSWLGRDTREACRALEPSVHLVPDYQETVWLRYADEETLGKTRFYPGRQALESLLAIGRQTRALHGIVVPPVPSDAVILTTGLFAEYTEGVEMEKEIALYRDLLHALSLRFPADRLHLKPHPRTSNAKEGELRQICKDMGATFLDKDVLLEVLLADSPGTNRLVVGPPSVNLVHMLALGYGHAMCCSMALLEDRLGQGYGAYPLGMKNIAEGHALLEFSGIPQVDSTDHLLALLDKGFLDPGRREERCEENAG